VQIEAGFNFGELQEKISIRVRTNMLQKRLNGTENAIDAYRTPLIGLKHPYHAVPPASDGHHFGTLVRTAPDVCRELRVYKTVNTTVPTVNSDTSSLLHDF
jgi:hypothetical protein